MYMYTVCVYCVTQRALPVFAVSHCGHCLLLCDAANATKLLG